MAIRVSLYQVCDRCQKPFAEQHPPFGEPIPEPTRQPLKLLRGDHVVLAYEDMCEDCDRVVQSLIRRLKMEPEPRKPRNADTPPDTEPQETEKPETAS